MIEYNKEELNTNMFTTRTGHGVSFGVKFTDLKEKELFNHYENQACFAPMRECFHAIKRPIAVYSSLHCNNEVANEISTYWDFIFDAKASPWRCLLKKGDKFTWTASHGKEKEIENERVDYRGPRSKNPNYCTVPVYADHTNAQTLVSLLMASRLGHDAPGSVRLFDSLVKDGMPRIDAFYTCLYLKQHEGKNKTLEYIPAAWYAFAANQNLEYKWFRDSTPDSDPKATWGKNYGFLQGIWYKGAPKQQLGVPAVAVQLTNFRRMMGGRVSTYSGSFAKAYTSRMGSLEQPNMSVPTYKELLVKSKEVFLELGK